MLFVQSTFLAALGAVAIPVIVHLMFRSQARRVNLGTLRFLKQVLERNARRQQIMRWLLLALRMAAVAMLAMLFARPYFLQAEPGGDKKAVIVLIDNSATMDLKSEQGRLVDQALAEARRIVSAQGPRTRIEAALFDHTVRPLANLAETDSADSKADERSRRNGVIEMLSKLPAPAASFRATNYGAALAWARDIAVRSQAADQELHLFTDLQQSGLDWTEVEPLPENLKVHLHDLGRAVVDNVAVTEARPIRAVLRPTETATIQTTVFNGGAFPIENATLLLRLETATNKVTQRERMKLEPQSTASVRFEVPGLESGAWRGSVTIEVDDELKFDNTRYLAIDVAAPYKILLVDGDPHAARVLSETYYLEMALHLAGREEQVSDSPFLPTALPWAADDRLPDLSTFDAVALANVGLVSDGDAARLAEYVQQGGGLIVFGGDHVLPNGYAGMAKAGLVPGTLVGPVLATDLPFRWGEWDPRHSLLAPFNDPQHGDLRRLAFRGYTKIVPNSDNNDVSVLAQFRGGDPALIERRLGQGRVLWLTTSADRSWSDWPNSRLYVPLIHQLVGQPLGLNDGGPVRTALLDAEANLPVATAPGVEAHPRFWQVINPSPRESETDRCRREDFASRFQLTLTDEGGLAMPATGKARSVESRHDEQWHWAALALAGLLVMESFVGNRTVS